MSFQVDKRFREGQRKEKKRKFADDAHSAHYALPARRRRNYAGTWRLMTDICWYPLVPTLCLAIGKESWTNAVMIRKYKLIVCTLPKGASIWNKVCDRYRKYSDVHKYIYLIGMRTYKCTHFMSNVWVSVVSTQWRQMLRRLHGYEHVCSRV